MRTLLLLAMLCAFGANAQQNSNYILPYRTQTRMLQVLQVNPNVTRDSVLVRTENGWIGSTPFPNWDNLRGRPTFSPVAISGAYNDLVGLPSVFPSSIASVAGLQTALNGKISIGANIPYGTLTGVPTSFPSTIGLVNGLQSELDGKQPIGNYLTSFTELDPTVPSFAKSLTGTTALRAITDALYRPIGYVPTSTEIATSLGYTPYNGVTNPNGYITLSQVPAALVSSVNSKTGSVVINAADIGLGNVNNTSDADKPISSAVQAALNGKQNAIARSFNNTATRTLNATGTQISTSRDAFVSYSVTHTVALTLLVTSGSSQVFLEISQNNSTWNPISQVGYSDGVAVAVVLNKSTTSNVQGVVPAGWFVRLRTTSAGGGSATYNSGQEVLL